ncbi:hypothetical protein Lfu02_08730 [Longispora fulva]|uniref:Uncharacterized protein n=1 Tax=Longispora fulva TaxID=619741 RepID=A0A8J7GEW0_9ACTN|nr:hypothetical protein [Longispora fulva]MBG6135262.1 hypothetical protein [Longispora fulva]GIG56501.1 hypothetical protein Lfu02_08730 [Longispora fulva]
MPDPSLTALYLDEVGRTGLTPTDLIPADRVHPVLEAFYQDKFLARPVFLGHAEYRRLTEDLGRLQDALESLPDKLFGGDLAAFARAVGMVGDQVDLVMRTQAGRPVTRFGRADLYADATGFRLMEYNMGSTVGLIEVSLLNDGMVEHPTLAAFAAEHGLGYVDTVGESLVSMRQETGLAADERPTMALCDWPGEYPANEAALKLCGALHEQYNVRTVSAHLGMLEYRDGRVWVGDDPIDVIYRIFMLEHAVLPGARELMTPLLDAADRGEVKIFTPIGCEVYGSKAALALLSDEAHRHLFDADTLATLDRLLPWTRVTRPGEVTLEDGTRVDLLPYALEHREDLVLKPVLLHSGHGVILGVDTDPDVWAERVASSMDGGAVLQRRLRPVPEPVLTADGEVVPYTINYGVFRMPSAPEGYGGTALRVAPEAKNIGVLSIYADPSCLLGSVLHATKG